MSSMSHTPEELQAVIEALNRSHAIIWFDSEGKILEANENFCTTMGYRQDEVVGKHHSMFIDPEYARSPEYQRFWSDLARGQVQMGEFDRVKKGGQLVKLDGSYNVILGPDGRATKVVKLAKDVSAYQAKLKSLLTNVAETSSSIAAEAEAMATTSSELSKRSENQAATVEQTSAAMEEIASIVKSNTQEAKAATSEAMNAKAIAEKGSEVVEQAIAAMAKIESGSKEIRKFIEVIDSIAFQTNLLALNAGVEAARAGDAGRGFAVVASEVRALAQRASGSAKDINALIDTSGREVEVGARLVNETGSVLTEIREGVVKVSDGIERIFSASQEQESGVIEVNKAIGIIDKDTQHNAQMAQQSSEAAANLALSSARLIEMANQFSGKVAAPKPPPARPAPARPVLQSAPPRPALDTPARKLAVNETRFVDSDEDWTEF